MNGKTRKLILTVCIVAALMIVAVATVFAVLFFAVNARAYITDRQNGVVYAYNKRQHDAFVSTIEWDGGSTTYELASTVHGQPVRALGGRQGWGNASSFAIEISLGERYPDADKYWLYDLEFFRQDRAELGKVEWEYIDFDITLPKDLEEIWHVENRASSATFRTDEGVVTHVVVPVVHLTIDPANPTFYTKEGKLYRRSNDTLVEDFVYAPLE